MRQFGKKLRPLIDMKNCIFLQTFGFCSITYLNVWMWYMAINKIHFQFEKGGCASIWTGVIEPDRSEKMENIWFPLNNLRLNDLILLKFIWYLTINKIQVEFEKGGYASILPPGITAPERREELLLFCFCSII